MKKHSITSVLWSNIELLFQLFVYGILEHHPRKKYRIHKNEKEIKMRVFTKIASKIAYVVGLAIGFILGIFS